MTIEEIVERAKAEHCEEWRCSMNSHDISRECVTDVAYRVAKAVVEECAALCELHASVSSITRDQHTAQICADAIRALAEQPGGKGR